MASNPLDHQVIVSWTDKVYPAFPYASDSHIVQALQSLFEAWGMDKENPFGNLVEPGQTILIKPNWVRNYLPQEKDFDALITHSSIISALLNFSIRALKSKGTIVIADAPLQNCDFEALIKKNRIQEVIQAARSDFPDMTFIIEDWRLTRLTRSKLQGNVQSSKDDFSGDETDTHKVVNIGKQSFLEDIAEYSDRFRVTRYKPSIMQKHHAQGKHEYLIARRVFNVDLMINVSKMKTHIKAGLTGALKSLIGINGHKEFLPHHIKGSYFEGGDNYCMPNPFRRWYENIYDEYWEKASNLSIMSRKRYEYTLTFLWNLSLLMSGERISAASWRGNETVWRTTLDLNHILYFFSNQRPRNILNIVDGIVAGEGEGPLSPRSKGVGILVGGKNPAYVDAVLAKMMGYNISRIPTVYEGIYNRRSHFAGPFLEDVNITQVYRHKAKEVTSFRALPNLHFVKPQYWQSASVE